MRGKLLGEGRREGRKEGGVEASGFTLQPRKEGKGYHPK